LIDITDSYTFQQDCFTRFQGQADALPLPERFTFPFYYQPHPLSALAAAELQHYLADQVDWVHNFGITEGVPGAIGMGHGKMFGVLVVKNQQGALGYLAAFSGKLAGRNDHARFVPPVFDLLLEDNFYQAEEQELNEMNRRIATLEQHPDLPEIELLLLQKTATAAQQLEAEKHKLKVAKLHRKQQRIHFEQEMTPEAFQEVQENFIRESLQDQFRFKELRRYWDQQIQAVQAQKNQLTDEIQALKEARKTKSAGVQQQIFEHYLFLNQSGTQKSLADIFQQGAATAPPAGAGECAAPKLLQYAFLHQLKPIAMAEFWWGVSHTGEVRKHGHFYPACRGKCEPILAHMLEGVEMDPNPMMTSSASDKAIDLVYEDDYFLVLNKPASLLSVPGKTITDSVYSRMKQQYPQATGPLIVHRLDMGTSGLMLVAKTAEIHKVLQSQFIRRTIKKRYVAVLEGTVREEKGVIDLPLRVDLEDRPRQMVCYEYGREARTQWEVIAREDGKTRIHFYPITGRTHQLRVHAAHPLGLNMPILGDDIYGNQGDRLHLHADQIAFVHPVSGEQMTIQVSAEF
jgi:tRNA pseudouridine32 synthase/23S rRNA pseudouridine746 synthase